MMCTCLTNRKSSPSAPVCVMRTTFTFLPFKLSSSVTILISAAVLGENPLSPVIITYLYPLGLFMLFLNSDGTPPARVKPNSSKASASGTMPASMYCE